MRTVSLAPVRAAAAVLMAHLAGAGACGTSSTDEPADTDTDTDVDTDTDTDVHLADIEITGAATDALDGSAADRRQCVIVFNPDQAPSDDGPAVLGSGEVDADGGYRVDGLDLRADPSRLWIAVWDCDPNHRGPATATRAFPSASRLPAQAWRGVPAGSTYQLDLRFINGADALELNRGLAAFATRARVEHGSVIVTLQDAGGSPAGGVVIDCDSCPIDGYYIDNTSDDGSLLSSGGFGNIATAGHLGMALLAPADKPETYRATGPGWSFTDLEAQGYPGFVLLLPWVGARD
jgi:hypothetical protein